MLKYFAYNRSSELIISFIIRYNLCAWSDISYIHRSLRSQHFLIMGKTAGCGCAGSRSAGSGGTGSPGSSFLVMNHGPVHKIILGSFLHMEIIDRSVQEFRGTVIIYKNLLAKNH